MTSRVTASKAKTELLNLLTRVEAGETITITRHGKPVALLIPHKPGSAITGGPPAAITSGGGGGNTAEIPTGLLRPAPDAAAAFPRDERRAAAELEPANPPARIAPVERSAPPTAEGSVEHKKTAPEPVLARAPVSKPKTLTLADVLRASREP